MAALETLLAGHEKLLREVRAIAHRHPKSKILAALGQSAIAALAAIEVTRRKPQLEPPYSSLGWWGENGQAPRVRDLLKSARFFDSMENCP